MSETVKSDEQPRKAKVMEMGRQGKEQVQISKELGIGQSRVCIILSREGIMSLPKIRIMLREYYTRLNAGEISNEDLAKMAGVYPETIARLIDEIRENKRIDTILEMAKQGKEQVQISKEVGIRLSRISIILKQNGVMSLPKIREMLREHYAKLEAREVSDEEFAKRAGVYPETIARLKDELQEAIKNAEKISIHKSVTEKETPKVKTVGPLSRTAKPRQTPTVNAVRPLSRTAKPRQTPTVNAVRPISRVAKQKQTPKMGVDEVSTKTTKAEGTYNVPKVETVARNHIVIEVDKKAKKPEEEKPVNSTTSIRQQQNTPKEQKRTNKELKAEKEEDITNRFLSLAKNIEDPHVIRRKLNISMDEIHYLLQYYGIFTRSQVVALLDSETDERIAAKGGLSLEAVKKVRQQEAAKDTPEAKELEFRKQKTIAMKKRQEAEPIFLSMARKFEEIEKIQSKLNYTEYEVTLLLRKHGIASRNEIERMIENNPNMSDKEIASRGRGSEHSVTKIREEVNRREKLIQSVPDKKREEIIRMLNSQTAVGYISSKLNVPNEQVKVLGKKWNRDSELRVSASRKQVDFTILINEIRFAIKTSRKNINKDAVQIKIQKLLALYPDFLTSKEYALMANACIQAGCYFEGVELCEDYLGLRSSTLKDAMKRIIEVVEQELPEKEIPATNPNIGGEAR